MSAMRVGVVQFDFTPTLGLLALCLALLLPGVCSAAAAEQGPESSSSLRLVSRSLSPNAPGYYNAIYLQATGACLRSGDNVSTNNGRTWQTEPMQPDFVSGLPHGYRRNPLTSALDQIGRAHV